MFPLKTFYWGHKGAQENYALQIRNIVEKAYDALGERPVLLGECGVPMDMKYAQLCFLSILEAHRIRGTVKAKLLRRETSSGRLG